MMNLRLKSYKNRINKTRKQGFNVVGLDPVRSGILRLSTGSSGTGFSFRFGYGFKSR
jgi:hypothetical protein